jgi:hypothetical protein
MSDKKIKVCFETTRNKLKNLLDDANTCPGHIVDGEVVRDRKKLMMLCDEYEFCFDCHEAFIDRITVGDENKEIETWKRATNYWHENWKELARFCKKNVQAEIPKSIKALIDGLHEDKDQ